MNASEQDLRQRLLWLFAGLAILTTPWSPSGWNDTSRWATVQSLVESGTLIIDQTAFVTTGDKVFIDGHFYSDKPPMAAVLGAIVYWPLHQLGIDLRLGRSLAHYLVTLLTVKAFWLLGAMAFFSMLRFTGLDAHKRVLASLALGAGSLYFTWSATLNNHILAAGALSIGFYFVLKARFESHVNRDLGAAALFLSLAGSVDLPTSVFYLLFLVYVVRDPRLRAGVIHYLLPTAVTFVPALAMNYAMHGSLTPVNVVRAYFEYPGSPWIGSEGLSGVRVNDAWFTVTYAFLALVGPRGFLLYNPFLWIALPALGRSMRRRGAFHDEALVVGSGSLLLVAYYVLTTNNYSGWSYSIRWFVPLLPLLLFFLYPFFETFTESRARAFRMLLAISAVIAIIGVSNPWPSPGVSDIPLIANVKEIPAKLGRLISR